MDPPGSLSPCACMKLVFMVVYLLASACCSETDCVCTDIPPWPRTKNATPGCFQNKAPFRYTCIDRYVRRAGTSNLIRCNQGKWSEPSLECIENPLDPPRTTTEKTSTTFPTSTTTPSPGHVSTMSSETEYSELTSTILPPQHTPDTPSTSPVSTSVSLTPGKFPSASSLSSPTTTHGPRRSDRTTSPSSAAFNSTSSTLGTDAVATKGPRRSDRTTSPSSSAFNSTSSTLGTDTVATKGPRRSDRTTSPSSAAFNITSSTLGTDAVATKGPRSSDRTTSPSSSAFNSTSSTLEADAVATKVIVPVAVGILILAVIGSVWFFYRRKPRKSPRRNGCERPLSPEESVPMQQTVDMT